MKSNENSVIAEVKALRMASHRLTGAADTWRNVALIMREAGKAHPSHISKVEARASRLTLAAETVASALSILEECP